MGAKAVGLGIDGNALGSKLSGTLEGGIRWHPERGQAVVERAWEVPECDFRPTSSRNPPILYMRPRIVKSSSKKQPGRFRNLNRGFGRQVRP